MLKVEETVDPELIIWENYSIKLKGRIFRRCIFIFVVLALLALCFDSVVTLEGQNYINDQKVPNVKCSGKENE